MITGLQFRTGFPLQLPSIGNRTFEFTDGLNVLFGTNGCLAEGTLVATPRGPIEIEKLKVGDIVYDEYGKEIPVLYTFNTGIKNVVELKNRYSTVVEATVDHVFLAKVSNLGKGSSDKKYRGVRVADFSIKGNNKIKRVYPISELGYKDVDYAYFLGVALGDGCSVQKTKNIHISSNNEEVIKKCSSILKSDYKKLNDNNHNYTWEILCKDHPEFYINWCKNRYAHEKIIDIEEIKTWNRSSILKLVAGLIDSDGSVYIKNNKVNKSVVVDIGMQSKSCIEFIKYAFLALWNINVNFNYDDRDKLINGSVVSVKVSNNVDSVRILKELDEYLMVDSKKFKPEYETWKSSKTKSDYMKLRLGNSRLVQTYDIHVGSLTNLYCLANGLVTHNSGKSVCLNTLKAYCSIPTGGWSRIVEPNTMAASSPKHFPYAYRSFTPASCDAWVGWDGTPTFFNDGDIKVDPTFFWDKERQSADGITSEGEQFEALTTKPSSGQYRIQRINKVMQVIQTPPNLSSIPDYIFDKTGAINQVNYINSLPRNGKMTLLFDEPERALALPKQQELFSILLDLSKSFQVIIATHSPFVLFTKGANIIDVQEGYADECREIIRECSKSWRKPKSFTK